MRYCEKCGKPVLGETAFCPVCGSPTRNAVEKERGGRLRSAGLEKANVPDTGASALPARKKKKRKLRLSPAAIAILGVLVIAMGALIWSLAAKAAQVKDTAAQQAASFGGQEENASGDTLLPGSLDSIETPNVTGKKQQEARAALEALGLSVETQTATYTASAGDDMVTAQSVAPGTVLKRGDYVVLTVNEAPLSCKVLRISPRKARIVMSNLVAACSSLGTSNPQYGYTLEIHADADYTLSGSFQCLIGQGEETPVKLRGTPTLTLNGKAMQGVENVLAGNDSITWLINIGEWTGFHFDQVERYTLTIANKADPALTIARDFIPGAVQTITLLSEPIDGGRIQLDAPESDRLILRLTDDALLDDYTNSPTPGGGEPYWKITVKENSYDWFSVELDGTHGEPLENMTVTCTQQYGKDARAASFSGATYSVMDRTLVISVPLSEDMPHDVYAVSLMEIVMGGGTQKLKVLE